MQNKIKNADQGRRFLSDSFDLCFYIIMAAGDLYWVRWVRRRPRHLEL